MAEPDTREVSIASARNRFAQLVHEVEQGPPVAVTRRGRAVAVLISVADYRRLHDSGAGLWQAVEAYRTGADLGDWPEGSDPWEGVRDQAPGREVTL